MTKKKSIPKRGRSGPKLKFDWPSLKKIGDHLDTGRNLHKDAYLATRWAANNGFPNRRYSARFNDDTQTVHIYRKK